MLKHYFKIALRNIYKDKVYSAINIVGLSIAVACCFLLIFWVKFEMSYERCYPNVDRIYRIVTEEIRDNRKVYHATRLSLNHASALKEIFPQLEAVGCFSAHSNSFIDEEKRNDLFGVNCILAIANTDYLQMFAFEYTEGSLENVVKNKGVILTEEAARKLFNHQSPIGKTITGNGTYQVDAVVKMPANTNLHFDILVPQARQGGPSYLLFKKGYKPTPEFEQQLNKQLSAYSNKELKVHLQRLKDVHLNTPEYMDPKAAGRRNQIYLFSFAVLLILVVAIINYVNTSIARAMNRMKEVGVRKVTGSEKKQLIERFLFESLILSAIAVVFAFMFAQLFFPDFSEIMDNKVPFRHDALTFIIALFVCLLVTLMSGGYAAFYLSSRNPLIILRGGSVTGSKEMLRKSLIGLQLFVSIAILLCTFIIHRQVDAIFNADTGVDRKNVIILESKLWYGVEDFIKIIKNENPNVIDATIASGPPYNAQWEYSGVSWEGSSEASKEIEFNQIACDYHYAQTFGLEMVSGEFIPPGLTWWQYAEANSTCIVINESFQKIMGEENPIGITVSYAYGLKGKIIGIVKDFNFKPLRTQITPLIISFNPEVSTTVFIKTTGYNKQSTLKYILTKYQEMRPKFYNNTIEPPIYRTIEDDYNAIYEPELRTARIFSFFAVISFLLSLMGVVSMALFMIEKRTKEIAIRKINGANIRNIILLFVTDMAKITLTASAIAIPVCYAIMHYWLQHYVYRTTLSAWIFGAIPLLTLLIISLTITLLVYLTARKNPVESLRSE